VPDSFALLAFGGTNTDADTWLAHFHSYAEYRQTPDDDVTAIFPLFLKDSAIDWYETVSGDVKANLNVLLDNFKSYFEKSALGYDFAEETVFTCVQRPKEEVRDYTAQMQKLAKQVPALENGMLPWVYVHRSMSA